MSATTSGSGQRRPSRASGWLQAALALLVLAGAAAIAWALISTKPSTRRKPRPREATLVDVVEMASVRRRVTIDVSGTIVPAHAVDVRPEVSGRVRKVGDVLVPGSIVSRGAVLAQLDPRDLQIAVTRARSALIRARAALATERGSQQIARRELKQFEAENPDRKREDKALALRKPQLDTALADLSDAKAVLAQAQLDASRTRITAPFDALLRTRTVTTGMYVTPTTVLATLVGTAQWWVEVTVPKDQLRWLSSEGAKVRIFDEAAWGPNVHREASVLRIGSEVVEGGRLVKVVIAVDDPLSLDSEGKPKMLLGAWARAQIEGAEVDAVELDRPLLRDGDSVWVMTAEDTLDVRQVVIGTRTRERVVILDGLVSGDRVVSSALRPVPGMRLRVRDAAPTEASR